MDNIIRGGTRAYAYKIKNQILPLHVQRCLPNFAYSLFQPAGLQDHQQFKTLLSKPHGSFGKRSGLQDQGQRTAIGKDHPRIYGNKRPL